MSTIAITPTGSKHELIIKQLVSKTTGCILCDAKKLPPELLENRLEISLLPDDDLSKIALGYMEALPETKFFSFSLHKIETYKDNDGKIYYSDTLVEELDGPALAGLKANIK